MAADEAEHRDTFPLDRMKGSALRTTMRHSFARGAAALVAALVASAALGRTALAAPSGPPVEIYAILSTTGNNGFFGGSEARALKAVETTVNAAGGINGHPVQFDVLDDQSSPQVTVQLLSGLVAKKVALFLGPTSPAGCFAVLPLIAVLDSTDGSGRDGDAAFAWAFRLPENKNLVQVAQEHFNPGDSTVAAQ